jgi:hypothetical protein
VEEAIVPRGGVALLRCKDAIRTDNEDLILTTDAVVAELPKDEKAPVGMPGGMGDRRNENPRGKTGVFLSASAAVRGPRRFECPGTSRLQFTL